MLRKIFVFVCILIFCQALWGGSGYFLEPYVGVSKLELQNTVNEVASVANNFSLGVKGGFNFGTQYFMGGDYHTGGPYKFGRNFSQAEWNHRMLGLGLGVDYRAIRFWAGYYPTNRFDDTINNTSYRGSATKFGFGLQLGGTQLRANIEVINHTFSERVVWTTTYTDVNFRSVETNAFVSIPVDLH